MRFLIVDDEALSLRNLNRILDRLYPGAEVKAYDDPQDALAAGDTDFTAAFLDIEMPGMTGIELAGALVRKNPQLNIIFVTAYDDYALDAYHIHASGYLTKPYNMEDILTEMDNLRFTPEVEEPKETQKKRVMIRCFGHFEVFVDDEPMRFERRTCKEILAYLVNLRGATATRIDISGALWEDSAEIERKKGYFRSLITSLRNSLKEYGLEDMLICRRDSYALNAQDADIDLYRYLNGDEDPSVQFHGEYMIQYSWAEDMIWTLEQRGMRKK